MENSQHTESPRIKISQLTQKNLAIIGICPELVMQSYPLDQKILMGLSALGLTIISILKFFFYEARTFYEYTQSSYIGSVAILMFFCLFIAAFEIEKLFDLINDYENHVNASEFQSILPGILFFSRKIKSHFSIKIFSIEVNFH